MQTHRFTRICILVVLVLLILAPGKSAFAAAPIFGSGTYDDNSPLAPFYQVCPGMVIWDHEVLTYHEIDYYDKQGSLTSVRTLYKGTDTFYNPDNPGVELSGAFSATSVYDLQTGSFSVMGIPIKITVPGYGTVLVRAGFWSGYPDIQVGGKNSLLDPKDVAAFCSLLSGH